MLKNITRGAKLDQRWNDYFTCWRLVKEKITADRQKWNIIEIRCTQLSTYKCRLAHTVDPHSRPQPLSSLV